MNAVLRLIAGFAAGAATMYLFDPASGRRRRALARDRGVAACRKTEGLAKAKTRWVADRAKGTLAQARRSLSNAPVDDERLQARVRAELGHVVARPAMVEVAVSDGRVVLQGRVQRPEIDILVDHVRAVAGVSGVVSHLMPYEDDEGAATGG